MKLNNNGWGYGMMVFLMTILCAFLLVGVYFIYKYYNSIDAKLIENFINIGTKLI